VPRDAVLLENETRPDLVALRKRGMRYIGATELAILDHIADNERPSEWKPIALGQAIVAGWIAEAPKGVHLVDFVIQRENELKRKRGASADEIEAEWAAFKEADLAAHPRRPGLEALGAIVARVVPEAPA
jgi:hypothetical protein